MLLHQICITYKKSLGKGEKAQRVTALNKISKQSSICQDQPIALNQRGCFGHIKTWIEDTKRRQILVYINSWCVYVLKNRFTRFTKKVLQSRNATAGLLINHHIEKMFWCKKSKNILLSCLWEYLLRRYTVWGCVQWKIACCSSWTSSSASHKSHVGEDLGFHHDVAVSKRRVWMKLGKKSVTNRTKKGTKKSREGLGTQLQKRPHHTHLAGFKRSSNVFLILTLKLYYKSHIILLG